MHHLQRKHCTTNSGMDAPSQTVTMHHGQRSACTIRLGVFTVDKPVDSVNNFLYIPGYWDEIHLQHQNIVTNFTLFHRNYRMVATNDDRYSVKTVSLTCSYGHGNMKQICAHIVLYIIMHPLHIVSVG